MNFGRATAGLGLRGYKVSARAAIGVVLSVVVLGADYTPKLRKANAYGACGLLLPITHADCAMFLLPFQFFFYFNILLQSVSGFQNIAGCNNVKYKEPFYPIISAAQTIPKIK